MNDQVHAQGSTNRLRGRTKENLGKSHFVNFLLSVYVKSILYDLFIAVIFC